METCRFPNKLKFYRRCTGYSQKKVARILGLSETSTLSRWEHGVAMPRVLLLFRLAHIYGVLPHELFDELWEQSDNKISLLALDDEPFIPNQSFYI